jgi:hypothetical protein
MKTIFTSAWTSELESRGSPLYNTVVPYLLAILVFPRKSL